jgi:hypothetical protein
MSQTRRPTSAQQGMHEARHRSIRRNPRYLHTLRRVAPSSGEHVV